MKITAYLLVSVCISLTTVLSGGAENGGRSGNETEDSDGRGRNPGLRVDGSPSSEPFPLQFSFVTTYGGGVGYADLSIPAMSLAVEHVNANSSVLPNFRLSYNLNKPFKCSTETAQDVFFHEVFSQDSIVAFLGSACSQATRPLAELVHRWNISQILSSPLAIEADAVSTLPNLLRLYPQGTALVPALLSLVTHSGWRRMLVITEMNDMFTTIFDVLDEKFQQQNITVSSREFSSMIENPVQDVPDLLGEMDDYRVIFLNMNPSPARKILCTAHKKGYVYPFYTWILYGWYGSDWWRKASDNDTDMCSDSAVMSVLERAISIRLYPALFDEDAVSDTGISYKEFQEQYSRRLMHSSHSDSRNTFLFSASLTYDAVWTLAMALHNVDIMSTQSVRPEACVNVHNASGNLRDFDYSNSYLGCLIKQQLQHTHFVGVSGRVNFNEERSRHISTITILQYRPLITSSGISQVVFATYNTSGNALNYVLGESNLTVFPDGIPPDGTPRNVILPFNIGLTVTYYIIATFGIAFTVVCLIYNIKYRKTRVVKLTSPTLNYFLIIGAFLMFFSIYIRLLPDTSKTAYQYRCNLQNWMNVIAYCLAYGTILAKMGRVYKIFHNPTPKKQTGVKDWHMVMVVALITGVGVLLLTVEASFPQLRPNLALLPSEEHGSGRDESGVVINYYVWQCYGGVARAPYYYLLLMFCYLILLQLIGFVLAIRTRKVKINILNDSKYIMAIIYVSSLVIVIMALVTFVSGTRLNLNEAFFSAGLLLSTSIFLSLTFIPKMVSYYRDPKGERVMKSVTGTHCVELQDSGGMTVKRPEQEKISRLEKRVVELERQLGIYKNLDDTNVTREDSSSTVDHDMISPMTAYSQLSENSLAQGRLSPYSTDRPCCEQTCNAECNGVIWLTMNGQCKPILKTNSTKESIVSSLTKRATISSNGPSTLLHAHHETNSNPTLSSRATTGSNSLSESQCVPSAAGHQEPPVISVLNESSISIQIGNEESDDGSSHSRADVDTDSA